jgi:hypothetical protein
MAPPWFGQIPPEDQNLPAISRNAEDCGKTMCTCLRGGGCSLDLRFRTEDPLRRPKTPARTSGDWGYQDFVSPRSPIRRKTR